MLLNFNQLIKKYNMNIKGVIHIGAHYGEEHNTYKNANIKNVVYFEPLIKNFNVLKELVKDGSLLYNYALGNEEKIVEMYVESANNGQSSSILKPEKHLIQYPHILFEEKEIVKMKKLDSIDIEFSLYNMINIDVQGYELEVFKGSIDMIHNIDYIITEVNRDEVYQNCTRIESLDNFLLFYGFTRVETTWDGGTWGDALYIKKHETKN